MSTRALEGILTIVFTGVFTGVFAGIQQTNRSIPENVRRNPHGNSHRSNHGSAHRRTNKQLLLSAWVLDIGGMTWMSLEWVFQCYLSKPMQILANHYWNLLQPMCFTADRLRLAWASHGLMVAWCYLHGFYELPYSDAAICRGFIWSGILWNPYRYQQVLKPHPYNPCN